MRTGLALGRKQSARNALAGRTLGKKRQGIFQGDYDRVHRLGDAAAGLGHRHVKQADQRRHQQERALPSCMARQRMKMQRPHAQPTVARMIDNTPPRPPPERHTD